jgi:uncharacterized glyoxalase superfamily protein PhnB
MTEQWEVAPILGVQNVLDAVEFFCEKLGFSRPLKLYGPADSPIYAIVSRGSVSVHLQLQRRPVSATPRDNDDGDGYFRVEDADALRAEFIANGVRLHRDIQDEPYGFRDFTIETPQGHRLSFGSPI